MVTDVLCMFFILPVLFVEFEHALVEHRADVFVEQKVGKLVEHDALA